MLRVRFNEALKEALKARDAAGASTLRLIIAALKDRDIAVRAENNHEGISEEAILQMLQGMVKQRHDSISLYEQGGRIDLVEREKAEILVIETFLPQPMSDVETETAIDAAIAALGAGGLKDMGRVMSALREKYTARMDFRKAGALIKTKLSA